MEKTDEQIIREFQAGHREAVNMIFERYKTPILKFCLRLLDNRADAEEAAGEVFLALLVTTYQVNPEVKFSTWLYTIARNQCVSQMRRRKHFISFWPLSSDRSTDEPWDIPDEKEPSREVLAKKEMATRVRQAIERLPPEQKEAIVLRQYEGFSYQEISVILGCSLEKVKILIFRAKERLHVELESFVKEGQI